MVKKLLLGLYDRISEKQDNSDEENDLDFSKSYLKDKALMIVDRF